jgi:hypothetical protein
MTLPTERQDNYQRPPPPPGYVVWQGADPINDPNTGESWLILIPDLQYADLLTPQVANYAYANIKMYNLATGETKLGKELVTEYDKSTEELNKDAKSPDFGKPIAGTGQMRSVLEKYLPYQPFMAATSYQALTNELIGEGVPEEAFSLKEVQDYLAPMMNEVALGRPMENVKAMAGWMKYVAEDTKQTKQNQADWQVHQNTPASTWMDKDIMRQKNPQGYQSDEYQWQPLVKKATARPQGMTKL